MEITNKLDYKTLIQVDALENKILNKMVSLDKLIRTYTLKHNDFEVALKNNPNLKEYMETGARQYEIMHLIETKRCNKVSELSKLLDLSPSSLSIIISKMVANNLVEKKYESTTDSRNVILTLTEKGSDNYYVLKNAYCQIVKNFISNLKEEELNLFFNALSNLTNALYMFSIKPIDENKDFDEITDLIFQNLFILKTPFEKFFRDIRHSLKDELTLTDKEITILILFLDFKTSTPSKIASLVHSSESTISTQLKKLVKKGHLEKSKSLEDSRITNFTLTKLGESTISHELSLLHIKSIELINTFQHQDKIKILDGLNSLHIMFELLLKEN